MVHHEQSGLESVGARRAGLDALRLLDVSHRVVTDLLETIDAVRQVVGRADAALAQAAKAGPRVGAQCALPGVGSLTAMIMPAEIGDLSRYSSACKPASRAGPTPTVRGLDRIVRCGHISKQDGPWLRWIMCEAGLSAGSSPKSAEDTSAVRGLRCSPLRSRCLSGVEDCVFAGRA
ncbi:transposase [Streptomyces sp. NPDC005122]